MPSRSGIPDWRDATAYAGLLHAGGSGFAWEWLRRRPDYRAAALAAVSARSRQSDQAILEEPEAGPWRLHAFVDPGLSVPLARPVWRADGFRSVLNAAAETSEDDCDALVLDRLESFATVIAGRELQHLLLTDSYRNLRLDIRGARLSDGPVRLHYDLSGFRRLPTDLLTLRQLAHLAGTGRFSAALHPRFARARRMVLMLRTFDALCAGASQRAIAANLLSNGAAGPHWRVRAPTVRSQVQRLVRSASVMAAGGFWKLL